MQVCISSLQRSGKKNVAILIMKQIKYYLLDDNFNLVEIPADSELVKSYSSADVKLMLAHDIEVYQLLKLEILPIDFKVAPIKELPNYYAERRKEFERAQKELWAESRLRIQKIIDDAKKEKRTYQKVLLRVNETSQGPFKEYDKKNDPRNRVNISKGVFVRRKKGKRPPPQT